MEVIPSGERKDWLSRRVTTILSSFKDLEELSRDQELPSLYGPNSAPDTHEFAGIDIVESKDKFVDIIQTCYKCFVESIDKYGFSLKKKKYRKSDISSAYPDLFEALERVRVYRHRWAHRVVEQDIRKKYDIFLEQDLQGRQIDEVDDPWFTLQQCVLDNLFASLQYEISRFSK